MIAVLRSLTCVLLITAPLSAAVTDSHASDTWDQDLRLATVTDRNADPRIIEVDMDARIASIEIAPGVRVDAWTYNGSVPGPLIRAKVGDRMIVHFTNHLPTATTIHWHGLRVGIEMDGVPGVSQPDVEPGGAFTYDFVLQDAGLFWYHPHIMSAAQVGFGLYGALLVDEPADPLADQRELPLVLSDIAISDGELEPPDSGGPAGMVFGREGNHILVNGREQPTLVARANAPMRWRIVNAAKSRYFELSLDKTRFTVIGTDGGLLEYAVDRETLVIAPGERFDVIVVPSGRPGGQVTVDALLYNRGYGSVEERNPLETLMTIKFADLPAAPAQPAPRVTRIIEALRPAGATHVNVRFTLSQGSDGSFAYGINDVPFGDGHPIPAAIGETQVWTLVNTTKWSHPFHLHGFFFQVADSAGQPVHPIAWKDTVDVPFESTVTVIVRFNERPGNWMFHCHVLDHADGGLMGWLALGTSAGPHHRRH